jgi:hypothetical protein
MTCPEQDQQQEKMIDKNNNIIIIIKTTMGTIITVAPSQRYHLRPNGTRAKIKNTIIRNWNNTILVL